MPTIFEVNDFPEAYGATLLKHIAIKKTRDLLNPSRAQSVLTIARQEGTPTAILNWTATSVPLRRPKGPPKAGTDWLNFLVVFLRPGPMLRLAPVVSRGGRRQGTQITWRLPMGTAVPYELSGSSR